MRRSIVYSPEQGVLMTLPAFGNPQPVKYCPVFSGFDEAVEWAKDKRPDCKIVGIFSPVNLAQESPDIEAGDKPCSKCGITKPLSEFYKIKRRKKDGYCEDSYRYRSKCKDCHNQSARDRRASNPDRVRLLDRDCYERKKLAVIQQTPQMLLDKLSELMQKKASHKAKAMLREAGFYFCTSCRRVKPIEHFYRRSGGKCRSQCIPCCRDSDGTIARLLGIPLELAPEKLIILKRLQLKLHRSIYLKERTNGEKRK